jgi:phosphoenolpyruvate synthase/pyruvate phosphate dikinase
LDQAADIWRLTRQEVVGALRDPGIDTSAAVRREARRLELWRRVSVPNSFRTEDVADMPLAGMDEEARRAVLWGDGISPGLAEGPACVLHAPDQGARLAAGSILVAPATDPAWTPLFARAAGVVTEIGGVLSHAGIVAREFGIPAVANVEDATSRLKDGETVWINGSSGRVVLQPHGGSDLG